ncbi:MAG: flagellar assembly protein FliW [bacterium]
MSAETILVKSRYYPEGVEVEKIKIIEFSKPILGFNDYKKFCILNVDKENNVPFFILQSIENENLSFIVTNPNLFFKDYSASITEEEKEIIDLKDKNDVIIFVIATMAANIADSTVNLKGPIVINTLNNKAIQCVLSNDNYAVNQKLPIAVK